MKAGILQTFIVLLFITGCSKKGPSYIVYDTSIDTIRCDRWELGLRGKAKTMDIRYYRPEPKLSFSKPRFKRGNPWQGEYRFSHVHIRFNEDGFKEKELWFTLEGDTIKNTTWLYNAEGYLMLDSAKIGSKGEESYLHKYDKAGRLVLEGPGMATHYGKKYEYDQQGRLTGKESIDRSGCLNCKVIYLYDPEGKLIEEQSFDDNDKLFDRSVYTYSKNDTRVNIRKYEVRYGKQLKTHTIQDFDAKGNVKREEWHYIYEDAAPGTEYNDNPRISEYSYDYDPNGILRRFSTRGGSGSGWTILEEYDKEGRKIKDDNLVPGFDLAIKDSTFYNYDPYKNWTNEKNFVYYRKPSNPLFQFSDLVELTRPWVEREFTYYE